MKRLSLTLLSTFIVLSLMSTDYKWTGATSGDWSVAANWENSLVPTSGS